MGKDMKKNLNKKNSKFVLNLHLLLGSKELSTIATS